MCVLQGRMEIPDLWFGRVISGRVNQPTWGSVLPLLACVRDLGELI